MRRFRKLLGMIFIFGIVFFIICDEKGYKIGFENNQIIFNKTEKKSDLVKVQPNPNAVYKNSDLIHLNYEFENPKALRKSEGMDPKYLAKLDQEKKEKVLEQERKEKEKNIEKSKKEEKTYTGPNIISLKNDDSISSMFQGSENMKNTGATKPEVKQNTGTTKPEIKQNTGATKPEVKQNTGTTKPEEIKEVVYYHIEKYEHNKLTLNLNKGIEIPKVKIDEYPLKGGLSLDLHNGKIPEPKILYKNSNRIKIYSGFENPRNMRTSAGIDEDFLAKQENKTPTILTLSDNRSTISNSFQSNDNISNDDSEFIGNLYETVDDKAEDDEQEIFESEPQLNIEEESGSGDYMYENTVGSEGNTIDTPNEILDNEEVEVTYDIEKYQHKNHSIDIEKSAEVQSTSSNYEPKEIYVNVNKPDLSRHLMEISEGKIPEIVLVKISKYKANKHILNLRKGIKIQHNFIVDDTTETQNNSKNGLSDVMLENLLANEEIDIDALESENDEFLQKVFEQTKDRDVMNLIVETYLNEYQFTKAKKFIENLPDMYRNELKPSLNLRVVFNSFSLSSKTISENLTSIVQDYSSKNEISEEDKNLYMGIIALIDRNYDHFFEISAGFTSENNKTFASKLQGYKDQIAKQMGMPEYYFDTLVALELFNKGLFQPAKVLALYSLQQNSDYILPYQVLAYANFLTNSRDTSIEYLKKLVDLDPNNAEKYRFLMGVASYRDEKYEQSVVMLSMIKEENLRLDTQRYLINNYIKLDQKNRLISTRNKLLGIENLVASDFYTYFYEAFFHPYSEGSEYEIYAYDTELANKMLRVCAITLENEEKAVCTYGTIGRNIAMGQFDGLEQYLLNLVAEYPQGYLYQALGDYYIQQGDLEKAKVYLIKAISLTQNKSERSQIKKLLQDTM